MKIRRTFSFDAAHKLESYHGKCERLHGHTYAFSLTVQGKPDREGMVLDFAELKRLTEDRVLSRLDHAYLNELMPQPTAENIAAWIWRSMEEGIRQMGCSLCEIEVWETKDCSAILTREDLE
ncbi:MAG: 6-carboxytetrahydropterin synthase QueD [Synergistaceae bacterium]|nr:6-carboxytetrahydropterin synthase QueD [Synergistaceae bacterium]